MIITSKKKTIIIFGAVTVVAVIIICLSLNVYAKENIKKSISTYLKSKGVAYTEVKMDGKTLSVKLASSGADYCTLDDVKAIQAVYAAIHGQTVNEAIGNVCIEIYDKNGKRIYDHEEYDVAEMIEDADLPANHEAYEIKDYSDNDIIRMAEETVSRLDYDIQKIEVKSADEITGKKIVIVLKMAEEQVEIGSDVISAYDSLKVFALSTETISQCEITVIDDDNDCLMFMTGDFKYGDSIAWVSPEIKDDFVAAHGPKPVD